MIIVRSPLRISIGGGGTDMPSYYKKKSGFLISASINKYIYITVGQTFNKIFLQDIDHNDEKYYLYELFNKNFHNETTNSFEKSEIFLIFDIDKISEKKYKNYKEKKIVLALNSIDEITNLENKETSYIDLVLFLKKEYKGTFDLDYLCIEDNSKIETLIDKLSDRDQAFPVICSTSGKLLGEIDRSIVMQSMKSKV